MVPATIVKNCHFWPYGFCHEYPYGLFHAMSFPIGVRHAGYHGFCHVILIGFPSVMNWAVGGKFRKLSMYPTPGAPTPTLFFQRVFCCNFFLSKIIVVCHEKHFLGIVRPSALASTGQCQGVGYCIFLVLQASNCVPPSRILSFIGPFQKNKVFSST